MVVIGPCSIHDVDAAREYARRLRGLADEVRHEDGGRRVVLVVRGEPAPRGGADAPDGL